jgi:CCT motif protein
MSFITREKAYLLFKMTVFQFIIERGLLTMLCFLSLRFEKRVRYASRKTRADGRKRVKGRFIKAGDAYDYDPLNHTSSV